MRIKEVASVIIKYLEDNNIELERLKIFKLLYFTNIEYYINYRKKLIDEDFIAYKDGPLSVVYNDKIPISYKYFNLKGDILLDNDKAIVYGLIILFMIFFFKINIKDLVNIINFFDKGIIDNFKDNLQIREIDKRINKETNEIWLNEIELIILNSKKEQFDNSIVNIKIIDNYLNEEIPEKWQEIKKLSKFNSKQKKLYKDIQDGLIDEYINLSSEELINLSHLDGSPWSKIYNKEKDNHDIIPLEESAIFYLGYKSKIYYSYFKEKNGKDL